jgi:hypothetical protein
MDRLRRVAPLTRAAAGACAGTSSTDRSSQGTPEPPDVGAKPAKLLSDDQMKSYIQNGYVALPVADMPSEWHTGLWQKCHDWLYRGEIEPQDDARWVFPSIPELSDVVLSPTVRGALQSILGPDYVQHPHRTMHNYGPSMYNQQDIGSDQTWVSPLVPHTGSRCDSLVLASLPCARARGVLLRRAYTALAYLRCCLSRHL